MTPIPRNVRLAEAPSFGKPILLYDDLSVGAKSYLSVAQELVRRVESPTTAERPTASIVIPESEISPPSEPDAVESEHVVSNPDADPLPEVTT
jgi:hypothetical protein